MAVAFGLLLTMLNTSCDGPQSVSEGSAHPTNKGNSCMALDTFNSSTQAQNEIQGILSFSPHFLPESAVSSRDNSYYSYFLYHFGEDNLIKSDRPESTMKIIRLLWLRSFHNPVMIKVINERDLTYASAKVSNGSGGYDFGKLVLSIDKASQTPTAFTFDSLIWATQVLNMSVYGASDSLISDGSIFVLEYLDKDQYKLIIRSSPTFKIDRRPDAIELMQFNRLCEYLLAQVSVSKYFEPYY